MEPMGILIDYHYCTGCHTCEVACQQENMYAAGQFGITVSEHITPTRDGLTINYVPFVTNLCNLCLHRIKKGQKPACVKHCLASCMYSGPVTELLEEMKKRPKCVLYRPR